MFRVLNKSRIPLFLHKKSNHIFTVWQHIVLLVLRQYEGKSYRMFVEWFIEAYYLRTSIIQLSHIPHYTTLQKFAATVSGTILERIISSFIMLLSNIRRLFIGIDSSGFKTTNASQYYTDKVNLHRKYLKLSTEVEVLCQIVCSIKIRRAPTRHNTIDFQPIVERTSEILPTIVSSCC
jgi:hypothetical protein